MGTSLCLKDGGAGFKLRATSFAMFPTVYHPTEVGPAGLLLATS
jgi:hypothetical protein